MCIWVKRWISRPVWNVVARTQGYGCSWPRSSIIWLNQENYLVHESICNWPSIFNTSLIYVLKLVLVIVLHTTSVLLYGWLVEYSSFVFHIFFIYFRLHSVLIDFQYIVSNSYQYYYAKGTICICRWSDKFIFSIMLSYASGQCLLDRSRRK